MHTRTLHAFALGAALSVASAAPALAEGVAFGRSAAPAPIEGTWYLAISPYDCATGQTFPVIFRSLISFHAGGTVTETSSSPFFQPGQRSISLGTWERYGQNSYHAVFEAYIQFNGGNYVRGVQRADQGIEMLDNDHWTSSGTVTFRNEAGTVVPPSNCMTAQGTRQP